MAGRVRLVAGRVDAMAGSSHIMAALVLGKGGGDIALTVFSVFRIYK